MKCTSMLVASFCIAMFLGISAPRAHASASNQATKVTFNQPVEIPGTTLTAGTYWFTRMSDDPDNDVVQVWGAHRRHLIATIVTVPDYHLHSTGKPVISFEENNSAHPEALRAWFYPGDNFGHEFVYPESRARGLAKRTGHPVLSMRDDAASNITKPAKSAKEPSVMAMKQAKVEAINPSGQEVDKSLAIQQMPQGMNQRSTPRR